MSKTKGTEQHLPSLLRSQDNKQRFTFTFLKRLFLAHVSFQFFKLQMKVFKRKRKIVGNYFDDTRRGITHNSSL